MRRRHVALLCTAAACLIAGWAFAPRVAVWSLALASSKGEEPSRRAHDRIVFFGERAIPRVIASVEEHSPWVPRYSYLPGALKEIGGSSRDQLVAAIKRQEDPIKRARLISSLQTGFDDYSKLETVIDDLESNRISGRALAHMASEVRERFPDAPPLLTRNREFHSNFKAYWETRSHLILASPTSPTPAKPPQPAAAEMTDPAGSSR